MQQPAAIPRERIEQAATLCALAQQSRRREPCAECNALDELNTGLAAEGLQLLESLQFNTFPLGLCSGFIAQEPRTGSIVVVLSAAFDWQQAPMPQFWDRVVDWRGYGRVAQVFAQTAANLEDTVRWALRRVTPRAGRYFQVYGFGLAAPVAYLLNLDAVPRAIELGFEARLPILFACPKFVDSRFKQWAQLGSILSLALDGDWLPRMPVTPLNWQFEWPATPLAIDLGYKPLFDDPQRPAQTVQVLPSAYLAALLRIK